MLSIQRLGRSCSYRAVSRPHILWEGKELLRGSQPHDSKLLKYTQNKSLSIGFVHDLCVHLRGLKKYSEDRVMAKGCKGNHPQIWLIHLFQLRIYFILVFPGWWRTRKECRDNGSFWGSTMEISWESWVAPLEWGWLAKNDPLDLQVSKGLLNPLKDLRLSNRSLSQSVRVRPLSSALGGVEWRFRCRFHCWTRQKNNPTNLRGRSCQVFAPKKHLEVRNFLLVGGACIYSTLS